MIYLYWYLGVGAVILVIMYAAHKWNSRSESDGLKDILDAMNPERKRLSYRIINNCLVPVLAAVLVLFVWPVAIYMKIKDTLNEQGERNESIHHRRHRVRHHWWLCRWRVG